MFDLATKHKLFSDRLRSLLGVMLMESDCGFSQQGQTTPNTTAATNCVDSPDKTTPANEMKIGSKRECGDADVAGVVKRLKVSGQCSDAAMPLFYYNLHRRKVKGVDLPK